MTDPVIAALIGVSGSVLVAITAMWTQVRVSSAMIAAELDRVRQQALLDEEGRRRERWGQRILEDIAELIAASEPQSASGADHGRAAILIQRLQLLLDRQMPAQAALNGAINHLGIQLHNYQTVQGKHIDDKSLETRHLLAAQGSVIDRTRPALDEISKRPT